MSVKDFYHFPGLENIVIARKNKVKPSTSGFINHTEYVSIIGTDGKIKASDTLIDIRFLKPLHTSDESEAIQKMKDMYFHCVGMDFGHSRCSKQCMTCYFSLS